MTLRDYLATKADRCPSCHFHIPTQGCACEGNRLKFRGMAVTSAAHPEDRAKVDAAIRTLAARGKPFSSNDARPLHGVTGPVVGAAFQAAARTGLIRRTGYEPSTEPGTHGHPVATWLGRAA